MFRDNLSKVVTSNMVGKMLSSSGLMINKVVIKIIKELPTEKANKKSSKPVGIGKSNTIRIPTIEQANAISLYLENFLKISNILLSQ